MSWRWLFDSTTAGDVPAHARMVGGYEDGAYPTAAVLRTRRPQPLVVSISTTGATRGAVIDCENGDVSPAAAAAYCLRELRDGRTPTGYTYLANLRALIRAAKAAKIRPEQICLWTAHYTNKPHICGRRCLLRYGIGPRWAKRIVATQYVTAPASGGHYDISLVRPAPAWLGVDPHPHPAPVPLERAATNLAVKLTVLLRRRRRALSAGGPVLLALRGEIDRVLAIKE